ncbi:hypothetical protein EAH89_25715 [Roseomonas nepalensis]|uniref:Alpha/beta hydrolase n=2 Tax=Muricoccus nepalensis TaxID=1854500 RepID=A0A502F8N6_9PROT|nr:hypothetical protein EAH89_25715 [Roseomonas nepalensis]
MAGLLCAPLPAMAQGYSTMSHEGLRTGVILRQSECPDRPGQAWVSAPYPDGTVEGVCIRYYAAGLAEANPKAVVFIHGNRLNQSYDEQGRLVRVGVSDSYGTPSEESLLRAAEAQSRALGHPFIIVARPGNYGSSGIASEQFRRREVALMNAALEAIKRRHRIDRFGIAAQSGGGPSLAGMLAARDDIACAAFSSALTALREREEAMGNAGRGPRLSQTLVDAYDPIRETGGIRASDQRRVFVVGDAEDKLIPYPAQQAYAGALARHGVKVTVATGTAVGSNRHSLGATGQHAVGWCLDGLPDDEIVSRMRRGEAAYVLPGGFY